MKRVALFSAFSFLSLVLMLGISSGNRRSVDPPASFIPAQTETAPSCRRVQGTACRPEGATIRCSLDSEIRVCVCENNAFNCR